MKVKVFNQKVADFLLNLAMPVSAKVARTIELLEKFEYGLGMPYSKKIAKRLFELRIRGKQEIRIIYTFHKNHIILLHCFFKKTRKLPLKEIVVAKTRLKSLD